MRASRIIVSVLSLAVVLAAPGRAQAPDSATAARFRVNFAVPDAPAFELVSGDPSKILRPMSVQELGVAVSNFAGSDNSFQLPRAFAAEFSPYLVARGSALTLGEYRRDAALRTLYHLRLSAATNKSADSARTQVGVGVRANLLDRADPRLNDDLLQDLTAISDSILDVYAIVLTKPPLAGNVQSGVVDPAILDAVARTEVDRLNALARTRKERYEAENWNREVVDVAYALRVSAVDSLGHDPRVDVHTFWGTWARPVNSWSQLLIGARGAFERDPDADDFGTELSVASRFYAGTNDLKFFAEIEWSGGSERPTTPLFHGGGELNLIGWAWTSFSFGAERDEETDRLRLVTRLSLKSGLPNLP